MLTFWRTVIEGMIPSEPSQQLNRLLQWHCKWVYYVPMLQMKSLRDREVKAFVPGLKPGSGELGPKAQQGTWELSVMRCVGAPPQQEGWGL